VAMETQTGAHGNAACLNTKSEINCLGLRLFLKRLIVGFGRVEVFSLIPLALLTTLSGRIMRRFLRRSLESCEGVRQFHLQWFCLGGCWKTSLLPGSILVEEGYY